MGFCIFCDRESVLNNDLAFSVHDKYPDSQGHLLIIPYRHTPDYFSMTTAERRACEDLLFLLREQQLAEDSTVTGFNIGMNCGVSAGQTVMHAHIHLIPRRDDDVDNPRGGVRGCIPGKMLY